jgi:DNA-binding LacI/PurR family transcriptional regulator
MATIRDVAEAAGVSMQTVSNVIHGKTFVRPEIQRRVHEEMARLNYQPSRVAQNMRRQTSQTLGLLLSDPNPRGLADPFYGEVLAGLVEAARGQDYGVRIEWLPSDQPLAAEQLSRPFLTRRIDAGLVFLHAAATATDDLLHGLCRARVPFAVLERELACDSAYSVQATNYDGAYAATERLLDAGHERLAFLDSTQRWPSIEQRRAGFLAAAEARGLRDEVQVISGPDWTAASGAVALATLLDTPAIARPTALLAATDVLAVGALEAAKARGLRMPGDLALIGFDDFEFARYVDPPLTTVRLPVFEMGRQAALLLLDHLQGRPAAQRRLVLPTELVVRQSG